MAKNSICFVANFSKTFFYHEVADKLVGNGVSVSWIVVRKELYDFLLQNYPSDKVLYINRSYIKKHNVPIGDFKLNELLFGDRVLKYNYVEGEAFLINIQRDIRDFLVKNQVSTVLGEVTWAHELLISRICNTYLHINYYSFQTIRIPNGRFCFFKDEYQLDIVEMPDEKISLNHHSIIGKSEFVVEKPDYLKKNDILLSKKSSVTGKMHRFVKMITNKNIDKNDPCNIPSGLKRYEIPFIEEKNRITYSMQKTVSGEDVYDKKYIFFGFHKQPEASVDVCGRYYENQVSNVINLWRQLPFDWYLVIKEHSNAIGDRGKSYFLQFEHYPRIILVDAHTDSQQLIKHAQLVATNTGTMALESALLGVPAFTFSPVFFNRLHRCPHIGIDTLRKMNNVEEIVNFIGNCSDNRDEYLTYIEHNSFVGENADPLFNPSGMTEENFLNVACAIQTVISL